MPTSYNQLDDFRAALLDVPVNTSPVFPAALSEIRALLFPLDGNQTPAYQLAEANQALDKYVHIVNSTGNSSLLTTYDNRLFNLNTAAQRFSLAAAPQTVSADNVNVNIAGNFPVELATHENSTFLIKLELSFPVSPSSLSVKFTLSERVYLNNPFPRTGNKLNKTGHTLSAGTKIQFTGNPPGGLATATDYYVISALLGVNDFQVSSTLNGVAADLSSDGSNTAYLLNPRVHEVILPVAPIQRLEVFDLSFEIITLPNVTISLSGAGLEIVNQVYTKTSEHIYTGNTNNSVTIQDMSAGEGAAVWFILHNNDAKYINISGTLVGTWEVNAGVAPAPTGTETESPTSVPVVFNDLSIAALNVNIVDRIKNSLSSEIKVDELLSLPPEKDDTIYRNLLKKHFSTPYRFAGLLGCYYLRYKKWQLTT